MAKQILIMRGPEDRLPSKLAEGELAFCLDTKKLFIGGTSDNVLLNGGASCIYTCTGTNDNVAISEYVNSFLMSSGEFADTTARTLKLTIVGNVGLSPTPTYGSGSSGDPWRWFDFSSNDTSNRHVHIDWSAADVPFLRFESTVNNASLNLMRHSVDGNFIYHSGLNMRCSFYTNTQTISGRGIFIASGTIHISNSYCTAAADATNYEYGTTGYGYCIYNEAGTLYLSNSYCSGYGAGRGYGGVYDTGGSGCGYGVYTASGKTYVSASHCTAEAAGEVANDLYGDARSYALLNSSGMLYVSDSYCYCNVHYGGNEDARHATAIYNVSGSTHISNSLCLVEGGGSLQGYNSPTWGVVNYSGDLFVVNSSCIAQKNYYSSAIGIATQGGNLEVSNCYCVGEGESGSSGISCSKGTIHVSNSRCIGEMIRTNGTYSSKGCGVILPTSSQAKIFLSNCCLVGYKKSSDGQGTSYGVCVETSNAACFVNIKDCYFPKITKDGSEQSGSLLLTGSGTGSKYSISGNIFHSATVSIHNQNITSITAADGKYMPQFANIFSMA